MWSTFTDEFQWKKFLLSGENVSAFTTCQWNVPKWVFITYRLSLVAYWWILPTVGIIDDSYIPFQEKYFAESPYKISNLTAWGLIIIELDYNWAAAIAIIVPCVRKTKRKSKATTESSSSGGNSTSGIQDGVLPWYCKVSWLLGNINTSVATFITIVYFGVLFGPNLKLSLLNLHVHGITTVSVILDNIVSARPCRLLHFIYPLVFLLIYYAFSVIYWSFDKVNHVNYRVILDWNEPEVTSSLGIGFIVLLLLVHVVHFLLYTLKMFVYGKFKGTHSQTSYSLEGRDNPISYIAEF